MHLSVIGSTGRTGQVLVAQALAAGHSVTALARTPGKLAVRDHDQLTVVQGDVLDRAALARSLDGTEAVLSALGQVKGGPTDLLTQAATALVEEMRARGLRRVLMISGQGVAIPGDAPKLPDRLIAGALRRLQPDLLRDAAAATEVVRSSGLDYTLPRPPRLTDKPGTGTYRVGRVGVGVGRTMSRADLALFMLDSARDGTYIGETPAVSS